jgi:CBS-domain-containing membrane protein
LEQEEAALGQYIKKIYELSMDSDVMAYVVPDFRELFSGFPSLYRTVLNARNDAMHSGVYARHATDAAIALCITLEEALMKEQEYKRITVGDFMVRSPISVEPWQPVAYARQLMLTHSFSYLPVKLNGRWMLLPEVSVAKFLHRKKERRELLAARIADVGGLKNNGASLELIEAQVVSVDDQVDQLLEQATPTIQTLWLVDDSHGGLAGVLSPFELM